MALEAQAGVIGAGMVPGDLHIGVPKGLKEQIGRLYMLSYDTKISKEERELVPRVPLERARFFQARPSTDQQP